MKTVKTHKHTMSLLAHSSVTVADPPPSFISPMLLALIALFTGIVRMTSALPSF